jgi:hypothetical protein
MNIDPSHRRNLPRHDVVAVLCKPFNKLPDTVTPAYAGVQTAYLPGVLSLKFATRFRHSRARQCPDSVIPGKPESSAFSVDWMSVPGLPHAGAGSTGMTIRISATN